MTNDVESAEEIVRCIECGDVIAHATFGGHDAQCVVIYDQTLISFSSWEYGADVRLTCSDCHD